VFFVFFCKPVDVVGGIPLRASCFDEGIRNVRVGCFSSKNISIFVDYGMKKLSLAIIPVWDLTL
jgi:hypothetical protein